MTGSNSFTIKSVKYAAGIFVLWFILFQFLPGINFRLKPGYIFKDLTNIIIIHYHTELLYTLFNVYVPLIVSYFFAKYIFIFFYKGRKRLVLALLTFYEILKYIPPVLPGIFFLVIWPESFYSEFCYLLLISFLIIFYHSLMLFQNFPEEMIVNLESISNIPGRVLNSVKWNFIKSDLIRKVRIYHFQIWSLALIYELLNKNFGIGDILFYAMNTKYISVIIAIVIITALIIFMVNKLLIIQEHKFLFVNE